MEQWIQYLTIYLASINFYGYLVMGIDKHRAKKSQWRISEKHLLGAALLGGSLGVWMGMRTFRHKTQHRSFQILVPAFMLLHIGLAIYVFGIWKPF